MGQIRLAVMAAAWLAVGPHRLQVPAQGLLVDGHAVGEGDRSVAARIGHRLHGHVLQFYRRKLCPQHVYGQYRYGQHVWSHYARGLHVVGQRGLCRVCRARGLNARHAGPRHRGRTVTVRWTNGAQGLARRRCDARICLAHGLGRVGALPIWLGLMLLVHPRQRPAMCLLFWPLWPAALCYGRANAVPVGAAVCVATAWWALKQPQRRQRLR